MTSKEQQLLKFIESFIEARGYPPSYSDMMDGTVTKSKGTINNRVKRLIASGHIAIASGISRSIRVLESAD